MGMEKIVMLLGDNPQVEAFLAQRIYEYNAAATGYRDAESFSALRRGDGGLIEGGACGYTWGGICYLGYLWVSKAHRGLGLGSELLAAVERHAKSRGCTRVLLWSYTFQAPAFYQRHGYRELARIEGHPAGHATVHLAKELEAG